MNTGNRVIQIFYLPSCVHSIPSMERKDHLRDLVPAPNIENEPRTQSHIVSILMRERWTGVVGNDVSVSTKVTSERSYPKSDNDGTSSSRVTCDATDLGRDLGFG